MTMQEKIVKFTKSYLRNLQWDGRDWIGFFATTFLGGSEREADIFRQWMANSVGKFFAPGSNYMLVLSGPAGVGKSHLARWLCPLPEAFLQGPIMDLSSRYMNAASHWIWESVELEGISKQADKEALKNFICAETVTFRRPYHTDYETHPAVASFLGTTTGRPRLFHNLVAGAFRFVTVKHIDWNYSSFVNPADLWAQAVAIYRGES